MLSCCLFVHDITLLKLKIKNIVNKDIKNCKSQLLNRNRNDKSGSTIQDNTENLNYDLKVGNNLNKNNNDKSVNIILDSNEKINSDLKVNNNLNFNIENKDSNLDFEINIKSMKGYLKYLYYMLNKHEEKYKKIFGPDI
jgi:hypothetical protein